MTDSFVKDKDSISEGQLFRQTKKWGFLALLCLSQLGQLYNSQAIPTLQVPMEKEMEMDDVKYSYLVIAETLPGFIAPLFGGYLVDYFGASKSFITTNLFIIIGQAICTLGAYQKSLFLFIIGKMMFNSAAEAAQLARSKIVRIWYINNDVGRALGAAVVMQTMAVIVCDLVYPNLYTLTQSLGFPFLMGVFVCIISAFFCLRCVTVHKQLLRLEGGASALNEGNEAISFKVIAKFPKIIWLLLAAASFGVDAFIIVKLYLSKWIQTSYDFSIGEAGAFLAFSSILTGVATPVAGILTDRYGKLPLFLILSIGLIQAGVASLIILPTCVHCMLPAIPVAFLSMGLGPLFIAGYSALVRIIDEKELGMATALIPVVISAEVIVLVLISGRVADATFASSGYTWVFTLALIVGMIGITFGFIVQAADTRGDKKLQSKNKAQSMLELSATQTEISDEGSERSEV